MSERKPGRLVLGEREVVLQEARARGGVYIDPHPEALKALQANHIDPYMIYERALVQQIEAKVPRIDFVQANVEELFEEWKSKADESPIHVRLLIWLKNNAQAHGYEQSGNSWILRT